MKAVELRNKSAEELQTLVGDLSKELFNLRFQKATSDQDVAVSRTRFIKRDIARTKTILRELELAKRTEA